MTSRILKPEDSYYADSPWIRDHRVGKPLTHAKPDELWVLRRLARERAALYAGINTPEHFYTNERFREIREP